MNQKAIKAGIDLLDQGGSAVDAALSVALSQITTTGGKAISFAGIFNMVYYEAETGKIYDLNASFNTVQNEMHPSSIPFVDYSLPYNDIPTNGRTVLVPGFMKGVGAAHARFGKLSFKRIFDHAIKVAENGTPWTLGDNRAFSQCRNTLTKYPETKAVFAKEDESFYKVGDIFKQPKLAETLRYVAKKGADYMYTGSWAKNFVRTVRKTGGNMTMRDMKNYRVIWSRPVHGTYHGYDIYTHGAPSLGGGMLLEKLNLAEAAELSASGHYAQSPEALYLLYLISTSRFHNYLSFDSSLLSKEYAAKKWKEITAEKGLGVKKEADFKSEHSAAIVVTDRWGNMAAILHSINTVQWGSNGLFVDGISIPDAAAFQQNKIISAGTGNRLPEETCPGIIFKDGKPILGFSCVGRGLINQSALALINILDFNLTPQQVNESPSIGSWSIRNGKVTLNIEPKKFSQTVIEKTTKLGGNFEESNSVGYWSAILRNNTTGEVNATNPISN